MYGRMVHKPLKSGLSYCLVKREPGNHRVVFRTFVQNCLVLTALSGFSATAAAKEWRRRLWSVHCEMPPEKQGQPSEGHLSAVRQATPAQTLGGVQDFHA